jgi:drug/metabolite transporter (DMT)-like permease
MKVRDLALLFLLAGLWGASFLFVRIAVPVLGPIPLVAARVLLGGGLLLLYARYIGQVVGWRQRWQRYLLLGLLNNAIPFTLIATAQLHLTASSAALLNATTPLFSAIIAAIWIKERLTAAKLIGLGLGLVGVGIVVGWQPEALNPTRLVSIALMLTAACAYGLAAVYGKVTFKGISPLATSTGQLLGSSMLMIPFALLQPPLRPVDGIVVVSVLGLAVLSTAAAYLIYFRLIDHAGPTIAASVTLLIPFFSSLWGGLFLGETLYTNELFGFAIILSGLLLVTGLWRALPRLRTSG